MQNLNFSKKSVFFFLLFGLLLLPWHLSAQASITISGKVLEYNMQQNSRLVELIFDDVLEDRINAISQIDSTGNFLFSLNRPFAQTGMLLLGDNMYSFFVAPGDSLFMEINYAKDEINFKGPRASFNEQLGNYYNFINSSQEDFTFRDSILMTSKPLEYRSYIDNQAAYFNKILSDFFKKNESSAEFIAWSNLERKYWRMTELMQYRWLHPFKNKIKRDSFLLTIPNEYFTFLEAPQLIDRIGLENQFCYYFLGEYYNYRFENTPEDSTAKMKELSENGNDLAAIRMNLLQLHTKDTSFTQDLLLARFYNQVLKEGRTNAFDTLVFEYPVWERNLQMLLFLKYNKVEALHDLSGKSSIHLNKTLDQVEKGIIDILVKQHPGKVLYIDFWATWCRPCIAEAPFAKGIKEQVDPEKVTFIYLGVMSSQESWETMIAIKNMEGEHYLLNDTQYKLLAEQFEITGIPHYLIIDAEGKIVNGNAPKPREAKELLELLNK